MLSAVQRNDPDAVDCMTSYSAAACFPRKQRDFADISRFKCPALIRAKPNSHKILQSHTFIITLHGYMYNSLQYHNRILKFSLFNTKGLFSDPPNPQKLTETRRNYNATSH